MPGQRDAQLFHLATHPEYVVSTEILEKNHERWIHPALFKNLPIGLIVLDTDGVVREANPVAELLLGMSGCGRKWNDIISETVIDSATATPGIRLRTDRIVELMTCALEAEPGQLVILNDITSRHIFREKEYRQRRLQYLGSMLACIAHQIRTPLSAAMLYATRKTESATGESSNLNKVYKSLRHIEQLVNDMLLYTSKGKILKTPVWVDSITEELVELSGSLLENSNCEFSVIMECSYARILGNRNAILGVLQNLIMNAAHACKRSGQIRLRVHQPDAKQVEFLISDNGPGISEDKQKYIFEPYYTCKQDAGTGIGLAIVDTVMRKHGGEVWLESVPGFGTTFGLVFPALTTNITDN